VVAHRDVVIAVLAAAAALGGLSLVYLGLLVAQGQTFVDRATERNPPLAVGPTIRDIPSWIRKSCLLVTVDTLAGLLCTGAALWWLVDLGTLGWPYPVMIVLFVVQLVALGLATIDMARRFGVRGR
jgi:hypothetical protein